MSLRVALLDDEPGAVETLEWLLAKYCPEVEVVFSGSDPIDAVTSLEALQPDLLFIDVEMPRLNGFDVLNRLNVLPRSVVFTTAYPEFAIKALRHAAIDYLLKPLDPQELRTAVGRALARRSDPAPTSALAPPPIVTSAAAPRPVTDTLALAYGQGYHFVQVQDVLYCESLNNYTRWHLADGKVVLTSYGLAVAENMLHQYGFLRIHKRYLVNPRVVVSYSRLDGGEVVLQNGSSLPLSKLRRQSFIDSMVGRTMDTQPPQSKD